MARGAVESVPAAGAANISVTTYRITHWETDYESAESRKLEFMRWVPMPTRQDDLVSRRIQLQKNRCELTAAWYLIVQVASKGRKGRRGRLEFDGRPLGAADLSLITGFPVRVFEAALEFFSDPATGWLTIESGAFTAQSAGVLAGHPGSPADSPGTTARPAATGQGGYTGQNKTGEEKEDMRQRRGCLLLSDQSSQTRERMIAVSAIFDRDESIPWQKQEFAAFKDAGLDDMPAGNYAEQIAWVQAYYAEPVGNLRMLWERPGKDFRRTTLLTLLRNWGGEVARAKAWRHWADKKMTDAAVGRL
jgi:hypothetical protein